MKSTIFLFLPFLYVIIFTGCKKDETDNYSLRAEELARNILIVDTHIDLPMRLHAEPEDITVRTTEGDFDYPRALEGGLDIPFMSIYIPARYEKTGGGKELADTLINLVYSLEKNYPDKFKVVTSTRDVTSYRKTGLILLAMGMENGTPINGDLKNIRYFYEKGIRYVTLAHSENNHICDSSYDEKPEWNGLSPFGEQVVREMNRVGIMIDVSHLTDSTFYDIIKLTEAPVIASHSSCRFFTPGWERNMSDDMIRILAQNGGVIQINFGSSFINDEYRRRSGSLRDSLRILLEEHNFDGDAEKRKKFISDFYKSNPLPYASVTDVADHIDHVVQIAGIDHVGIGSDFEGVGNSLPTGLKDVSMYPNLIEELLIRGYTDEQVEKIFGGNLLRVWKSVEKIAAELSRKN
ncbi:MAG: dipeptidase [Ignavibacteriaceae bacterium]